MSLAIATRHTQWPALLPFEIALGIEDTPTILDRHELSWAEWDLIQNNASFRKELINAHKEVAESGISFRRKAAIQAEMYLAELDSVMFAVDTAPSTKLEIFKTLVKCGDLEPVHKGESAPVGNAFNIQINF